VVPSIINPFVLDGSPRLLEKTGLRGCRLWSNMLGFMHCYNKSYMLKKIKIKWKHQCNIWFVLYGWAKLHRSPYKI
jgi:hypothetical protein